MIEGVRGTSIGIESVVACLESNAESREYMLTYFWGKGTYFYRGDGSIYLLGGWVEIFGGMNTPIPQPPWICTPGSSPNFFQDFSSLFMIFGQK